MEVLYFLATLATITGLGFFIARGTGINELPSDEYAYEAEVLKEMEVRRQFCRQSGLPDPYER